MAESSVITYNEATFTVTPAIKAAYDTNGYILLRQVLNPAEVQKMRKALESPQMQENAYVTASGDSRETRMILWFYAKDDVTGVLASLHKIAGTMEELMGGDEVYHFSSKVLMKGPKTGGSFTWHQDYGYFYNWGYLYPDSGSVFIAVDDCTEENGCLQVLRGSHRMGRIDHKVQGKQLEVDPERVEAAKARLDQISMEMKAGDVLYFPSTLIHCSGPNTSDQRRWSYVIAYNQRHNKSYMTPEHPRYTPHPDYTPLPKLPNTALLECENYNTEGKWFLKAEEDRARD
ncbi:ectoine dioxygenase-like [Homarus americanus]|uniref:L-proline trans-4-hydroxylase-like 1 n=1 Tax=Homarus americanus TaxID=6706 RepID=A0A8J5JKI2_HOMAM|nr:ectoine dioxygenase-like [Homarus americanus]KAG7157544.1 L-proline trans-4-hydroxylase-like 1 [Homarus americanus]